MEGELDRRDGPLGAADCRHVSGLVSRAANTSIHIGSIIGPMYAGCGSY